MFVKSLMLFILFIKAVKGFPNMISLNAGADIPTNMINSTLPTAMRSDQREIVSMKNLKILPK